MVDLEYTEELNKFFAEQNAQYHHRFAQRMADLREAIIEKDVMAEAHNTVTIAPVPDPISPKPIIPQV